MRFDYLRNRNAPREDWNSLAAEIKEELAVITPQLVKEVDTSGDYLYFELLQTTRLLEEFVDMAASGASDREMAFDKRLEAIDRIMSGSLPEEWETRTEFETTGTTPSFAPGDSSPKTTTTSDVPTVPNLGTPATPANTIPN